MATVLQELEKTETSAVSTSTLSGIAAGGSGRSLIIVQTDATKTRRISSVTDSGGNTYVQLVAQGVSGAGNLQIWAKLGDSNPATSVTVTLSGTGKMTWELLEVDGLASLGDESSGNDLTTASTSYATPTITRNQASEWHLAAVAVPLGSATFTPSAGWTALNGSTGGSAAVSLGLAFQEFNTTGSDHCTFTGPSSTGSVGTIGIPLAATGSSVVGSAAGSASTSGSATGTVSTPSTPVDGTAAGSAATSGSAVGNIFTGSIVGSPLGSGNPGGSSASIRATPLAANEGDLVVVVFGWSVSGDTHSLATVADDKLNTWSPPVQLKSLHGAGGYSYTTVGVGKSWTDGANGITGTLDTGSGGGRTWIAIVIRAADLAGGVDTHVEAVDLVTNTPSVTLNTLAQAAEALLLMDAAFSNNGAAPVFAWNRGWRELAHIHGTSAGLTFGLGVAELDVNSTAPVTGGLTSGNVSDTHGLSILAIKRAGPVLGTAAGTASTSGTAAARRDLPGAAAGTAATAGAATGAVQGNVVGSATGAASTTGSAAGTVTTPSTAVVTDTFTRTVSGGLGTADTGQAITIYQGQASDYAVDGSAAQITMPAGQAPIFGYAVDEQTFDFLYSYSFDTDPTGSSQKMGPAWWIVDALNYYRCSIQKATGGATTVFLQQQVNNVNTDIPMDWGAGPTTAAFTLPIAQTAGQKYWCRFRVEDDAGTLTFKIKIWQDGDPEPGTWLGTGTDIAGAAATTGALGWRGQTTASNTNTPTYTLDDVTVTSASVPTNGIGTATGSASTSGTATGLGGTGATGMVPGSDVSTSPIGNTPGIYSSAWTSTNNKVGRGHDAAESAGVGYIASGSDHTIDFSGGGSGVDRTSTPYLCAYDIETGAVVTTWHPATAEVFGCQIIDGGANIMWWGNQGVKITNALSGPQDTTPATSSISIAVSGGIVQTGTVLEAAGIAYFGGTFSTVDGQAHSKVFKMHKVGGVWSVDHSWTASIGGTQVQAVAAKSDGSKVVFGGDFPNAMAAFDASGASARWDFQYASETGAQHVICAACDDDVVWLGGDLGEGGGVAICFDWNGSGPNTFSNFIGGFNCYRFVEGDGNVQALAKLTTGGRDLVLIGHHGNVVASQIDQKQGLNDLAANGIYSAAWGVDDGGDTSTTEFTHPPDFTANTSEAGVLKVWGIRQTWPSGRLHVLGDFNRVNSLVHQRYTRFDPPQQTATPTSVTGTATGSASTSGTATAAGPTSGAATAVLIAAGDLVNTNEANVANYIKTNYYDTGVASGFAIAGDNAYQDGSDAEFNSEFDPNYGGMVFDPAGNQWIFPSTGSHDFGAWGAGGAVGAGITGYKSYYHDTMGMVIWDTPPPASPNPPTTPYDSYYYHTGTVRNGPGSDPAPLLDPSGAETAWCLINVSGVDAVTATADTDGLVIALEPGSAQHTWLSNALSYCAANNLYAVIVCAHALYTADCSGAGGGHAPEPKIQPLWDLLASTGMLGKSIVIGGHNHNYQRFLPQDNLGNALAGDTGTVQFVVGTAGLSGGYTADSTPANWATKPGGGNAYSPTIHGALELTLKPTGYDFRFINSADGSVFDSGSVTLAAIQTVTQVTGTATGSATTGGSAVAGGLAALSYSTPAHVDIDGATGGFTSSDIPSGAQVGDLLVAHVTWTKVGAAGNTIGNTAGGMTALGQTGDGTEIKQAVFYKFLTAGDLSAASFTFACAGTSPDQGGSIELQWIRNVDPSTPFGAPAQAASSGMDITPSVPTATAADGADVLNFVSTTSGPVPYSEDGCLLGMMPRESTGGIVSGSGITRLEGATRWNRPMAMGHSMYPWTMPTTFPEASGTDGVIDDWNNNRLTFFSWPSQTSWHSVFNADGADPTPFLLQIAQGDHDDSIAAMATALQSWGQPVWLRLWWEMNSGDPPWNIGNAVAGGATTQAGQDAWKEAFIGAWRRIYTILKGDEALRLHTNAILPSGSTAISAGQLVGAQNVIVDWNPNSFDKFTDGDTRDDCWPGDGTYDYADAVGNEGYIKGTDTNGGNTTITTMEQIISFGAATSGSDAHVPMTHFIEDAPTTAKPKVTKQLLGGNGEGGIRWTGSADTTAATARAQSMLPGLKNHPQWKTFVYWDGGSTGSNGQSSMDNGSGSVLPASIISALQAWGADPYMNPVLTDTFVTKGSGWTTHYEQRRALGNKGTNYGAGQVGTFCQRKTIVGGDASSNDLQTAGFGRWASMSVALNPVSVASSVSGTASGSATTSGSAAALRSRNATASATATTAGAAIGQAVAPAFGTAAGGATTTGSAAGHLGVRSSAAGAAATAASVRARRLSANPSLWQKPISNGGRGNAVIADPLQPGRALGIGDVFGEHTTVDGGMSWTPRMKGIHVSTSATIAGGIYGRTGVWSRKHPGRVYIGNGTLNGLGGGSYAIDLAGANPFAPTALPGTRQFGTNPGATLPDGTAPGDSMPRLGCGQLMDVWYPGTGAELLFGAYNGGLTRWTDEATPTNLITGTFDGSSQANNAWKALICVDEGGSPVLYAATYGLGGLTSTVYRITSPDGTPTVTTLAVAPTQVNDFAVLNGELYACGHGHVWKVTDAGATWTAINGTFANTRTIASLTIADRGGVPTIVALTSDKVTTGEHIMVGTESGGTWSFEWVPTSVYTGVNIHDGEPYWLNGQSNHILGLGSYMGATVRFDADTDRVYMSGAQGMFVTDDFFARVYPAGYGFGGGEDSKIIATGPGSFESHDVDYAAILTTDSWETYTQGTQSDGGTTDLLTVTANGSTYVLTRSTPASITKDGVELGDDYFKAACLAPIGIAVDSKGTIGVALDGGGILRYLNPSGFAEGSANTSGSAAGHVGANGAAAGTAATAGAATGQSAPRVLGTAAGTASTAATTSGVRTGHGSATSTISTGASAAARVGRRGSASSASSTAGAAVGVGRPRVLGSAAGAASTAGTAAAHRALPGTATGSATTAGHANGTQATGKLGTAHGAASTTASAAGRRAVDRTAQGSATTTGSAAGTAVTPQLGSAAGTAATSGAAVGQHSGNPVGSAAGTATTNATAAGHRLVRGSAAGGSSTTGQAAGTLPFVSHGSGFSTSSTGGSASGHLGAHGAGASASTTNATASGIRTGHGQGQGPSATGGEAAGHPSRFGTAASSTTTLAAVAGRRGIYGAAVDAVATTGAAQGVGRIVYWIGKGGMSSRPQHRGWIGKGGMGDTVE